MEQIFKLWTGYVAIGVAGAAGIIIAAAAVEAIWRTLRLLLTRSGASEEGSAADAREEVRLRLARWLAVALEFALAADILRTAIAPSWDEIGKLAAIATLRTLLNYVLQREIERKDLRQRRLAKP